MTERERLARPTILQRRLSVSIVRVGLAETKNFGEGFEAIFGKKKAAPEKKAKKASAKAAGSKKKSKKK